MFAKNELVFTSWGKILASFGKDLCGVFSCLENSLHYLMARILTNLLQKSSSNRLASQK
ncbi:MULTISPECIES: hypothetical protein [Vibrio]|uniref:hypothetical protein n=1 Tax=Vibrio TaxID=662 RepID=UPI00215CBAD2|nr:MULTISPECIES: hypothetical protein [Vibrio]MCR9308268.1 hypothetical protein [Vibrio diabolicus]